MPRAQDWGVGVGRASASARTTGHVSDSLCDSRRGLLLSLFLDHQGGGCALLQMISRRHLSRRVSGVPHIRGPRGNFYKMLMRGSEPDL